MNTSYRIRCRCDKCGRIQLADIGTLVAGEAKCPAQSIIKPPCGGRLEYYSSDPADSADNALSLLNYLVARSRNLAPAVGAIAESVAEDLALWLERPASPQDMGWVDWRGQP